MYNIHNRTLNPSTFVPTLFIGVGELGWYRGQAQTVVQRIAVLED